MGILKLLTQFTSDAFKQQRAKLDSRPQLVAMVLNLCYELPSNLTRDIISVPLNCCWLPSVNLTVGFSILKVYKNRDKK